MTSARAICPAGHSRPAGEKCSRCTQVAQQRVAQLLASQLEGLSVVEAMAYVAQATRSRFKSAGLAAHLDAHPDALTSGDSDCPKAVIDLLRVLVDAGVDGVQLARCVSCHHPQRHLQTLADGGRLCEACRNLIRAEPCDRCERTLPVVRRLANGRALCQRCQAADPASWKPCSLCGTLSRIVARVDGTAIGRCCYAPPVTRCTVCGIAKGVKPWKTRRPVCALCAQQPRVPCSHCGKDAAVPPEETEPVCAVCATVTVAPCQQCGTLTAGRDKDGQPRCSDCYQRPVRSCGRCGRVRAIVRLSVGDDPDLCAICWTGSTAICESCGDLRPCRGERRGRMLCSKCSPVAPQRCAHCGRQRRVCAHWHEGPVCAPCYRRALEAKGTCPGCDQTRRLMVYPGATQRICSTCAKAEPFSVCDRCGTEDALYRRGRCPACSLSEVLEEMLGDTATRAGNGLAPVFDRLVELDRPRWVLDWLQRQHSSAAILARIGTGELALEHQTFDELPPSTGTWFLERLLVTAGALPARDPVLARMERWTTDFLGEIADPERRRMLSRFATWQILRPLRTKSAEVALSGSVHNAHKTVLKTANTFLEWLDADGRTLADCTQTVIEEWPRTGPSSWRRVAGFLSWAHQQRLVGELEFPKRNDGTPTAPAADDARWATARRLLYEPGIDLELRVAGLLVVLYAQTLARVIRLRRDDVVRHDSRTELRLGDSPITLPPPLDEHVLALASRRGTDNVHQITGGEPWLFPGHMPGQPRHAGNLAKRLRQLGIPNNDYRQAALAHLASTMPAAIVADLLGVSIRTATQWAKLTGRQWSDYLAHR